MNIKLIFGASLLLLVPIAGQANTIIAQDNANDTAYSGGSFNGQNGGFGFSLFSVVTTNAINTSGSFIGTAADSEGNTGTPAPSSINTNGKSFGLYAKSSGDSTTVTRGFSTSFFQPGQAFSLDFVKGYNDFGTSGVVLTSAAGTIGDFTYSHANGGHLIFNGTDTNLGFISGADHLLYTITGLTTYSFQSTGADNFSGSGTFSGPITGFQVKLTDVGNSGTDHQSYFNNLSLTAAPEPSQMAAISLMVLGLGGLLVRRRQMRVTKNL